MSVNATNTIIQNYNRPNTVFAGGQYNTSTISQNQAYSTNYNLTAPQNFKGLDKDTVEISEKQNVEQKKRLSKGAKWALGIGGVIVAGIAAATIHSKIKCSQLEKLYKEKLVMKDLGEHIDFKPAETIEDAMKFTRETLGIKEIDKDFSLDALNCVNEKLVDVSNKNKGKLFMPTALRFKIPANGDSYLAYVNPDIHSKEFLEMGINKNYFDNEFLTKEINELLSNNFDKNGKNILTGERKQIQKYGYAFGLDKDYWDLVEKFKKNSSSLTIAEKRKIVYTQTKGKEQSFSTQISDTTSILDKIIKLLEKDGKHDVKIDKQAFEKLSYKEQCEKIAQLIKDNELRYPIHIPTNDGSKTIYHEMGHIQDYGKNLKNMDISTQKWYNIFSKNKALDEINNRMGGTTYKGFKELLEKKPDEFKLLYPDLYEHLTNDTIKKTAGKVSTYAQTSIGEFIADTYAKMINGEKIPDDVMALYKKYNGPMLG